MDAYAAPLDLDELAALEKAATPGPWKADTETRGDCVLWGPDGQFVANAQAEPHWLPAADGGKRAVMFDVDRRDVELIAAMRSALPALLDELATERRQGAAMASITGEAIRQIGEERDAAREELAKTRAELDHLRKVLDTASQTTAAAQQIVTAALADGTARINPATTAEPADEPKAVSAEWIETAKAAIANAGPVVAATSEAEPVAPNLAGCVDYSTLSPTFGGTVSVVPIPDTTAEPDPELQARGQGIIV